MKRFTETEKWADPWFRKMSPSHKLLWLYILDRCDGSGYIDLDEDLAEFLIGSKVDLKSFLQKSNGRFLIIEGNKLWVRKFVSFHNGEHLSEASKPHAYVIRLLKKNKIWQEYTKGIDRVSIGYVKGIDTLKEKNPYKNQEQEGDPY